ncbi:MAG: hypothetical protein COU71_02145 [Parcubacteria group bacterium CG10_big_fil_rev_8_21_14_0_10_38_31]|nr:MAG: hypothetical protein COU71_02145 [Parcubacteria group bacterium CG10_big_fil_rev_8_21_14_0_10_38_31]
MKHNKHLLILSLFLFALLFVGIVGVFGASFFVFRKINTKEVVDNKYSVTGSRELVRDWIMVNASTYKFDGSGLTFRGYKKLDCAFCYEFTFGFDSRNVGYGDRIDSELVSSTTAHSLMIVSETGMISRAITDGKYDEMKGELIQEETFRQLE